MTTMTRQPWEMTNIEYARSKVARALPASEYPDLQPTESAPATPGYTVQGRWDGAKLGLRVEWATRARWITKDGRLTRSGERIAQSKWADLSPAAQRLLAQEIVQDYPQLAQHQERSSALPDSAILKTDAVLVRKGHPTA